MKKCRVSRVEGRGVLRFTSRALRLLFAATRNTEYGIRNAFPRIPIIVTGLSLHSAPVTVRERFAFVEARIPAALQLLRDSGTAQEAVILSTCNRVEIYAATTLDARLAFAALRDFLVTCHEYHDPLTD